MTTESCRCGHSGDGPHPCHFAVYTCGKPAKPRFYAVGPATLPGASLKVSALQTWACDECWEKYQEIQKQKHGT